MQAIISFQFTHNFKANLADIVAFLAEGDAIGAYAALLDELETSTIPNLERFPAIGRPFMARPRRSMEVSLQVPTLKARLAQLGLGSELREYVMRDYLILYTFNADHGYLLSIKHHRQLSFDFSSLWERGNYPAYESSHGKLLLQQERAAYPQTQE